MAGRKTSTGLIGVLLGSLLAGVTAGMDVLANYVSDLPLRIIFIASVALLSGVLFLLTTIGCTSKKMSWIRTRVSSFRRLPCGLSTR